MNNCEQSEVLKEHEQRLHAGDLVLQRIEGKVDDLTTEVKEIKGDVKDVSKSVQEDRLTLAKHDLIIKAISVLSGIVATSLIGLIVDRLFN
jgi:hypothetical protein